MQRLLVVAAFLVACDSTTYQPVPAAEIDQAQRAAAETFGTSMLSAWNDGQYPDKSAELTPKMAEAFTADKQPGHAKENIDKLGKFKSMSFVEVETSTPAKYIVYRFKGTWEKMEGWEVRVVYGTEGKIGGFWVKPWKDSL